jgi:ABC-type transport system substrate-binding protein
MSTGKGSLSKVWPLILLLPLLAVACGGSAAPTATHIPVPTMPPQAVNPTLVATTPTPTQAAATATPPVAPAITSLPTGIVSARDHITVAVPDEPAQVDLFLSLGGTQNAGIRDAMAESLTWQSGDDLRVVPTTASESWEQVAPDKWRFHLRQEVKFHNGEVWNAQAAMPSLELQSSTAGGSSSAGRTGPYTAEAVGEYTVEFTCACPILPVTTTRMLFAPLITSLLPQRMNGLGMR